MSATSDIAELFNELKIERKAAKERRLANADLTGWFKHTDYHYSRLIDGKKMDYWPSTGLVMYKGTRHNIKSKFVQSKLNQGVNHG